MVGASTSMQSASMRSAIALRKHWPQLTHDSTRIALLQLAMERKAANETGQSRQHIRLQPSRRGPLGRAHGFEGRHDGARHQSSRMPKGKYAWALPRREP